MSTDTPILRADIRDMSTPDYESWLTSVRERQMANRRKFEEVERAKSLARVDKLSPKLEAKLARIAKKMNKIDEDISKITVLMNEASTFRMEIEVELRLAGTDHPELRLTQPTRDGGDGEEDSTDTGTSLGSDDDSSGETAA